MLPALGAVYSGVGVGCAVEMQKLSSRDWARAGCLLAMVPIHAGGVMIVSAVCLQFVMKALDMDQEYTEFLMAVVMVKIWLVSLGIAVRALVTLQKPEVIDGFNYQGE